MGASSVSGAKVINPSDPSDPSNPSDPIHAAVSFAALIEEHYLVLRRIAARALRDRHGLASMSPTSLVAESAIRMLNQRTKPASEAHLRGIATVFMARILADEARHRLRVKRNSGKRPRSLDDPTIAFELAAAHDATEAPDAQFTASVKRDALLNAMEQVAEEAPRAMEVVTLHLVAGLSLERVAELTETSLRTTYRDLDHGKALLARQLSHDMLGDGSAA